MEGPAPPKAAQPRPLAAVPPTEIRRTRGSAGKAEQKAKDLPFVHLLEGFSFCGDLS
jgi:hypothetical protein